MRTGFPILHHTCSFSPATVRSFDHAMREEAEVELNVWPCEMYYQHVISPFRRDKDKGAYLSAKKIEVGAPATIRARGKPRHSGRSQFLPLSGRIRVNASPRLKTRPKLSAGGPSRGAVRSATNSLVRHMRSSEHFGVCLP
jgi:hypothetical protein